MENMSDSSSSGSLHADSSARRSRGLTTMSKWKGKNIQLTDDDFDDLLRPKGTRSTGFRYYIGVVARSMVNINYGDWRHVEPGLKDAIWEDIKTTCNLKDDKLKKRILKIAGVRMRNFKNKLVTKWIRGKRPRSNTPMQMYNFISEEDWEEFTKTVASKKFQDLSGKAKESQSHNKYPHHMGAAGYAGMKEVWAKNDPLAQLSACRTVPESILLSDRSWDYLRGRLSVRPDGTLVIPADMQEVYDTVIEKSQEVDQGKFVPKRQHDILSAALGKDDHPGRPRTFGGYVGGVRAVFGNPGQGSRKRQTRRVSDDDEYASERDAKFDRRVQQEVVKTLRAVGIRVPASMPEITQTVPPPSSSSDFHTSFEPDPFMAIKKITSCTLALAMEGQIQEVAKGSCFPFDEETVVHGVQLAEENVKVRVEMASAWCRPLALPIPVRDDLVNIGEALGSLVQWPKYLVRLVKDTVPKRKTRASPSKKTQSYAMLATGQRQLVDEVTYQCLPPACKQLIDLVNFMPAGNDTLGVTLDDGLFPASPITEIYITAGDIVEFMTMGCLNAPILEVFQMYLHRNRMTYKVPIGFLSPSQIAPVMIKSQYQQTQIYINRAMIELRDKKYIMVPYCQSNHWLLIIIEPLANTVYIMDSLATQERDLDVRPLLVVAFRALSAEPGTRRSKIQWRSLPCTQQPGGTECGYCVMKNMSDIVIRYSQGDDVQQGCEFQEYSQDDIDSVRDNWATFFRSVFD